LGVGFSHTLLVTGPMRQQEFPQRSRYVLGCWSDASDDWGWAYPGKDVCISVFQWRSMLMRQNYTHKTGLFMLALSNPNVKKVL
jgi:hypothetical protein